MTRKHIFFLLLLPFFEAFHSVNAQDNVAEFWIYDTSKVECFYASAAIIPDTIAKLKKGLDSLTKGKKIILYWDRGKKHKYLELLPGGKNNHITYYRNGQLNEEFLNYDSAGNPIEHFRWKAFYSNGKKKGELVYSGKTRTAIYYYQNGQVRWKDVDVFGAHPSRPNSYQYVYTENFCENGQLIGKDSINSTTLRIATVYYCNGKIHMQWKHNGANQFGKWREWNEDGSPSVEGQYDETIPEDKLLNYQVSKKQGLWKYYNEKGKLVREEVYKDGEVVSTKEYK